MQFDHSEQVGTLAQLPAAPAPLAKPARGLWRAAADSLIGAGAKIVASMTELGSAVGPALALGADPTSNELLEAVKKPPDFRQNEISKPFRDFERRMRPDPVTAGTAERIVYGAVGPMATVVGGALTGGVPGVLGVAAESGFSASEDLAQQGVDLKTRSAVGAVTAAGTALAVLPAAGQTIKGTVALYLAGGPGGFVAQQAATRAILERADYAEIARQYDPLDPVGLTLSALVPLPFAALGVKRNLASRQVVDAAMTHNLTAAADRIGEGPDQALVPPARAAVEAEPPAAPVPLPRREPTPQETTALATITAARQAVIDGADLAALPAEVRNLAVGLAEAGPDSVRAARMADDFVRSTTAQPGKSPIDLAADVVEASRRDGLVTPKPELPPAKDAHAQSIQERVAAIERDQPDLRVSDDGTAAQVLANARKAAAEGTDAELGALDADLVRVAAECALMTAA